MKVLRNLTICLLMVLSLVPFKTALAETIPQPPSTARKYVVYCVAGNYYYTDWTNANISNLRVDTNNALKYDYQNTTFKDYKWNGSIWVNDFTYTATATKQTETLSYGTVKQSSELLYKTDGTQLCPQVTIEVQPIDLKIIQPSSSPFKDTTDSFNMLIWYKYPLGTTATDINIRVTCPTIIETNWEITGQEYNSTTGEGWLKVNANNVSSGENNITVISGNMSKTMIYTKLTGVVDENGDTIDDRTGLPVDNGHAPTVPDGDFITNSITTLKGFTTEFQGFQTFITGFLGVFPSWITAPIAVLFTVLVIMTIVKIIRG